CHVLSLSPMLAVPARHRPRRSPTSLEILRFSTQMSSMMGIIFRSVCSMLFARVVVIFPTKSYTERRFCRLEMRLALAGCDAEVKQIVLALGGDSVAVLDVMPAAVDDQNWPAATEREHLDMLVRQRLNSVSIA